MHAICIHRKKIHHHAIWDLRFQGAARTGCHRNPLRAIGVLHEGSQMSNKYSPLVIILSVLLTAWSSHLMAAAATADAADGTTASSADPADAPTSTATAPDGDQLTEITVTAQRIESNALTTPIAITELSDNQLTQSNVLSTTDLKGLVPSLNIIQQGQYGNNETAIYIRGVGVASRFFNQDIGVGVYLDDLYLPTTQNLNLSFYDVRDVQVLEGPQGTLFGRNTLGGAVLLETTPPGKEFDGYAQVTLGSFNRVDTQGAIDMPFSDVLTSRLAFFTSNVDGYITHLLNNQTNDNIDEKSARYELRFQPDGTFTADLMGEYGVSHDNGNEEITVACDPQAHYIEDYDKVHSVPYCTQYAPLGKPYEVYGNSVADFPTPPGSGLTMTGGFLPFDAGEAGTLALRMSWAVSDELTLKSISGLRNSDLASYRDDGTPAGIYTEYDDFRDRDYSEELQALAKVWGGRLNMVAGLYYFHDDASSVQDTGPDYDDPVGYYYNNITIEKSLAAYFQGTLAVTSKLSVIAGVRGTHDEKSTASAVWEGCTGSYLEEYTTDTGGCWIPGPTINDFATASGTWHHVDPRFQLQYQWTPDWMTYISATSGYLAGGFNAQLPYFPPPPYNLPFQQETVWNYELGTKGEWLQRRLRVSFDVFDQIFKNLQSGVLEYYNGIDVTTTTSAANGHERGVELEVDAIPVTNLTLTATASYLDQGYDEIFPDAYAAGLRQNAAITSAPKDTFALVANYTFHVSGGATVVPSVNYRYVGVQWDGTYPLQYLAPGYALLGANVAYNSPDRRWQVAFWGSNITNKYYYESYAAPNYSLNTNIGIQQVVPGRPRELGVTVRWTY